MKYRYEIIWTSDDDLIPTQHHTFVEVSHPSMRSALSRFESLYHKVVRGLSAYGVVQCIFLGGVIEK